MPDAEAFHRNALQKLRLRAGGRWFKAELAIGVRGSDAALRRAFNVTFHDEIWLIHFFDRAGLLADRNCQRVQTDWTTIKFLN